MLTIDGAYGEGGGQVLRTSLALSVLTGRPLRIMRIRANRRNPGLAPQHLTNVLALAAICDAEVAGAHPGSRELVFRPGKEARPGSYTFDVAEAARRGSAGSVTLILQTLLLPLAMAGGESSLSLYGGTHVPWSPPADYLARVYLPLLARCGVHVSLRLERCGFYPHGGGLLTARVRPVQGSLLSLDMRERGGLVRLSCTALLSGLDRDIGRRMLAQAEQILASRGISLDHAENLALAGGGPGAFFSLLAEYEQGLAGFSALGARGKPAEMVAAEACAGFFQHHESLAPVDRHLADQLLLPLALARGESFLHVAAISGHLTTNAHVIEQFLPVRIEMEGREGRPGLVRIHAP